MHADNELTAFIHKLKEKLDPNELDLLIENVNDNPQSFLSVLQEKSTPGTENFIDKLDSTLSKIKEDFETHQSPVKSILDFNDIFLELAQLLTDLSVGEIKYVLIHTLEREEGEMLVGYWLKDLEQSFYESDYQLVVKDERSSRFV